MSFSMATPAFAQHSMSFSQVVTIGKPLPVIAPAHETTAMSLLTPGFEQLNDPTALVADCPGAKGPATVITLVMPATKLEIVQFEMFCSLFVAAVTTDRKSTRLNSSHVSE